ncbi:MAG: trigger factor [Acidobacteriota bacterium]
MKLEVVVTDVSQVKKDLAIEVAAEEVKTEYEKAYDAYARHAKVPGFRPGRVPRGVVKQRFSKEVKDEVIGQLLPHALEHAVVENKLRFIGEPRIEDISVSEGEPLKFKASIEVLPEIKLEEYKGLKAIKRVVRVTDESVEQVIEQWRENAAEKVPVEDRPSQDGDFISVNLVGKYVDPQEPHEQEDLKADKVEIEIGGQGTQPEFSENLRGVKVDDVREFQVVYPEDFGSKGLAGKTLDFTATVVAVGQKELPELNDDFAKDFGEFETVQEMRDKIRENLVSQAENQADSKLRGQLLEQLLRGYDFEVPSVLIEQQAHERLNELANMLMRSGMSPQELKGMNWEAHFNEARLRAVQEVRTAMVVSLIGEAEGVKASEDEIDAEIERMRATTGETAEQLKARLTREEAISSIENRLRFQKALDAVIHNAEITVEEITENEQQEQSEQQEARQDHSKARAEAQAEAQAAAE